MPDTNRLGNVVAVLTTTPVAFSSSRWNATADAGSASAFFEMNTRPADVDAQSVLLSPAARATRDTVPLTLVLPYRYGPGHAGSPFDFVPHGPYVSLVV